MMNLSINLTLGSPGAESVLNTAPVPEDGAVDSFSLKLADELSEQELTPPIVVEDTRAVDPALLEAIAARQKLAADSEVATAKDGRVWLDDPLAGLPVTAENEAELTDTGTEDKPWFDIIEKAKSYGPALQANKTTEGSNTTALLNQDHALVGAEDLPQLPLADLLTLPEQPATISSDAATAEAVLAAARVETDSTALTKAASPAAAVVSAEEPTAPAHQVMAEAKVSELVNSGITQHDAMSQSSHNLVTQAAVEQVVAEQQVVGSDGASNNSAPQMADATSSDPSAAASAATIVTTESVSGTAQKTALAAGAEPLAEKSIVADEAESLLATAVAGHTETAKDVETTVQSAKQPADVKASGSVLAAAASAENAVSAASQQTESLQQAELVSPAMAVPVNPGRTTTTVSGDKTQTVNTFAEHMKAVNQTQQQQLQQQAGEEQQTGQGQSKAAAEMMLANQPAPTAVNAVSFSQHLQQLQPTQPLTEQTATTAALTQPVAQSSAAGQATQLAARPAETSGWQAPLALTEPAAAQQLKDRVMVQIQHKLQTAEVQLHPEDMGSMQIKLNLQQDQLSVQFVVQQGAAKEALEQQMPRLRELLEQQGIALTEGQVEQRQSGGQQEQRQGRSGPSAGGETDLPAVQTVQMKVSDRMVDFYA
ncbi:flagellar hook-length control protein FliK [Rheinheimera texasensis]|uniref:flagellar hook-length control protein FliK n=1 Tax=Rheinheimera texasensis TaxID=306205 RepID=UPI0004E25F94|nr:flagellar hook-length control protein FliK [Rheinheimera texasensis]